MKRVFKFIGIAALVFSISVGAYISTSVGVDYVHGFGKACEIYHDGWHFRDQCGVPVPPVP